MEYTLTFKGESDFMFNAHYSLDTHQHKKAARCTSAGQETPKKWPINGVMRAVEK